MEPGNGYGLVVAVNESDHVQIGEDWIGGKLARQVLEEIK